MENNKFKKISIVFMTIAILVSGHSYAYYKHVCTITQRVTQSLSADSFLCKVDTKSDDLSKKKSFSAKSCCELTKIINKTEVGNNHQFEFKAPIKVVSVLYFNYLFDFDFTKTVIQSIKNTVFESLQFYSFTKLYILNSVFII